MIQEYTISGLHCPACETKVKSTLLQQAGVENVVVDRDAGKVIIRAAKSLDTNALNQALGLVGKYSIQLV
jgi:copper chaperone CopZ